MGRLHDRGPGPPADGVRDRAGAALPDPVRDGRVDVIDYLRDHATEDGNAGRDDGRRRREVRRLAHDLRALLGRRAAGSSGSSRRSRRTRDWLTTVTPSQWLEREPPIGRVYVPTCSYAEMGEWALPPDETVVFTRLLHDAVARQRPGGALAARRVLAQLPGQVPRDQRPPQADAADVGQGRGDARGPGAGRGGRPPPPRPVERLLLARAVRRHLHQPHAARDVRAPDRRRGRAPTAALGTRRGRRTSLDLDIDGRDEVRLAEPGPGRDGQAGRGRRASARWDIRAARHALGAVLRRRPEAYHETLRDHEAKARPARPARRPATATSRLDPRHRDGQGGGPRGAAPLRRPRAALRPRPVPRARRRRPRRSRRRARASWATSATASGRSTTSRRARSRCRARARSHGQPVGGLARRSGSRGGRLDPQLVIELEVHHRGDGADRDPAGPRAAAPPARRRRQPVGLVRRRRRPDRATTAAARPRASRRSATATTGSGSRSRRAPSRPRTPGGARSRPSPTPSPASSASTRAAPCCCRGPPRSRPARRAGSP